MNPQDLMYTQRRFSLLHLVSFMVFIAFLIYGGYVFMTKAALAEEVSAAEGSIADLEDQISDLEAQSLDEATVAYNVMMALEEVEIAWSEVIAELLEVTPLDIYYSSYGGNEMGNVTVSAMGDSYYSVAGLIEALNEESNFKDMFVPSVAMSDSDGMAGFTFSFTYDDTAVAR